MLHVARGYSLRETVVRAKVANWADISDVALLKRLRGSEEWLGLMCSELIRENVAWRHEERTGRKIRNRRQRESVYRLRSMQRNSED